MQLVHRDLERHAEAAVAACGQLDDPKGWQGNLNHYQRAAGMKAVVLDESAADVMAKAPLHFPAHKQRVDTFAAQEDLLAVGLFGAA